MTGRKYRRLVRREQLARAHREAALHGGGAREVARRQRQIARRAMKEMRK